MRTAAKVSFLVVAIVLIIIVIAGFVLTKVVNPNDFKQQIANQVEKRTGRQLTINGDVSFSFFPWLGLQIEKAELSNPANFSSTTHFASIDEIDVTIKLIPLLSGDIEIGKVLLDRPVINLVKNADGSNNWKDLSSAKATDDDSKESSTEKKIEKEKKFSIKEIAINDGQVNFQDKQKHSTFSIEDIDIDSSDMGFNKTFPVKINATFVNATSKLNAQLQSKIKYHKKEQLLTAENLKANLSLSNKGNDKLETTITGNLIADLANGSFSLDKVHASGNLINFNSNKIQAKNNFKNINGDFRFTQLNLKKIIGLLSSPITTSDPRVLQNLSATGIFNVNNDKFTVNNATFQLDDSKGQADVTYDFSAPKLGFNVTLDQINLDRYMSNSSAPQKTSGQSTTNKQTTKQNASSARAASKSNTLPIDGNFTIHTLRVSDKTLSNVKGHLIVQSNTTKLSPLTANVFGGSLNSNVTITQGARPVINIAGKLSGAQIADLTQSKRISGLANVNTQLTMSGNDKNQLLASLNGPLSFDLQNTTVEGFDLSYQLSRVTNFLKKLPQPSSSNTNKTVFSTISGSGNFTQGVFNNNQLRMVSAPGIITGSGTANLNTQRLNYRLLVKPQEPIKLSSDKLAIKFRSSEIPITVTGTFDHPNVTPDFAAITKSLIQSGIEGGTNLLIKGTTVPVGETLKAPAKILDTILGN